MAHFKSKLQSFLDAVRDDFDRTVQFWLKYSHDAEHGGFFNCLSERGEIYDDLKYGWLQARQVWMYAKIYNEVERFRKPEILDIAVKGGKFLMQHLKDKNTSKCFFLVTREGKPVKNQRTLFCECFYLMAMSELSRATKQLEYKDEAMEMFEKIKYWATVDDSELGRTMLDGCTPTNSLGVPMMVLCIIDQLLSMDESLSDQLKDITDWAVKQTLAHVQRNGKVVLEHVSTDGKELPGSQGRLTVPGHVIECGWFLLKVAQRNNDKDLIKLVTETFILKPFNNGWDKDHKGLFYFLDVDAWSPTQLEWNMKLWWPHNEAMISLLMAFQQTKEPIYLEKFEEVFHYVYKHFVDEDRGEWYGYLNQEGKINMRFKGGPFKGCFHVPRALMMCEQILEQLLQAQDCE